MDVPLPLPLPHFTSLYLPLYLPPLPALPARLKQENELLKSGNGFSRRNIRTIWNYQKERAKAWGKQFM